MKMLSRLALVLVAVLACASHVQAQTVHPCDAVVSGPFIVTTGRPYIAQWCYPTTATVEGTDVPLPVERFTVKVDSGADQPVGKPASGVPSTVSKLQFYSTPSASGVQKGSHTLTVTAWMFKVVANPDGTYTTTTELQPGGTLVIPFVGTDPMFTGPLPAPVKGRVIKQ